MIKYHLWSFENPHLKTLLKVNQWFCEKNGKGSYPARKECRLRIVDCLGPLNNKSYTKVLTTWKWDWFPVCRTLAQKSRSYVIEITLKVIWKVHTLWIRSGTKLRIVRNTLEIYSLQTGTSQPSFKQTRRLFLLSWRHHNMWAISGRNSCSH